MITTEYIYNKLTKLNNKLIKLPATINTKNNKINGEYIEFIILNLLTPACEDVLYIGGNNKYPDILINNNQKIEIKFRIDNNGLSNTGLAISNIQNNFSLDDILIYIKGERVDTDNQTLKLKLQFVDYVWEHLYIKNNELVINKHSSTKCIQFTSIKNNYTKSKINNLLNIFSNTNNMKMNFSNGKFEFFMHGLKNGYSWDELVDLFTKTSNSHFIRDNNNYKMGETLAEIDFNKDIIKSKTRNYQNLGTKVRRFGKTPDIHDKKYIEIRSKFEGYCNKYDELMNDVNTAA